MKGTLGMPVTTTLDGPVVGFTDTRELMNLVLSEMGVEDIKFKYTISGTCVLDIHVLKCGGDTPSTNIVEVGVYIYPDLYPKIDITKPRGIPIRG